MKRTLRAALVVVALATVGVAGSAGAAKLITGKSIKNGSIGLADLSASAKRALEGDTGATGSQGPQGPAGAPGHTGPSGPASIATTVRSHEFFAPPNDFADGEVRCPTGMVAVGGSVAPGALFTVFDGPSTDGRGWLGSAIEANGETGDSMLVIAICTPGTSQVLSTGASVGRSNVEALKAAAEAAHER